MPKTKATKIEVFNRKTGEVVETKEIADMKSWSYYWDHQCDAETFGWRTVGEGEK